MLNPSFPQSAMTPDNGKYIAPEGISDLTLQGNAQFDVGEELRLQDVYGDEIWI